jgi:hypothetical protein
MDKSILVKEQRKLLRAPQKWGGGQWDVGVRVAELSLTEAALD